MSDGVVMLVREEARTLARALSSVATVANQIVVGVDDTTRDESADPMRRWEPSPARVSW